MKKSRLLVLLVCLSLVFTLASCDFFDTLKDARTEAIAQVEALATEEAYASLDKAEVSKIIEDAKTTIAEAASEEGIEKAVANAKNALDKLVLDGVKSNAKAELKAYVDLSLYSADNKALIEGKIKEASAAIDKCTDAKSVADKLSAAKAEIDTVKVALDEAKDAAKANLDTYVDLTLYSEENKALIETEIAAAKTDIDACETEEAVSERLNAAKAVIDALPTLLDTAIKAAVAEIEGYVADLSVYSEENKAEIERIITDAKINIEATTSEEIVSVILDDAKADIDEIPTVAEENAIKAQALKDIMVSVPTTDRNGNRIEDVVRDYVKVDENGNLVVDTAGVDGEIALHFGNQDRNYNVVFDTYFIVDYASAKWSTLNIRFSAWDESQNLTMEIKDGSLYFYRNYWSGGKVTVLLTKAASGIKEGEMLHLQIIRYDGWKKMVLINGECVFLLDTGTNTVGRIYIKTWQAGVTFINPVYKEYDSKEELEADYAEELKKPCVNKSEAELLEEAKVAAKTAIASYLQDVDTLYSEAGKAQIAEVISAGNTALDACGSIAEVEAKTTEIKQQLDTVLTIEEEANHELIEKRVAAVTEIKAYLGDVEALYSKDNQEVIAGILSAGELTINDCATVDAVDAAVVAIKSELDVVLTLEEEHAALAETFLNSLSYKDGTNFLEKDEATGEYKYVTLEDGKVAFNTKVAGLGGQVQFGTQTGNTNRVFDVKMTIDYNSTQWDWVTIRFGSWDTSNNIKIDIKHDSIKIYYCKWGEDPVLLTEHTAGFADGQEVHLQLISKGWTKMVVVDGECILKYIRNAATAGYTMIYTWESSVVFSEPIYKVYATEADLAAEYGDVVNKSSIYGTIQQ